MLGLKLDVLSYFEPGFEHFSQNALFLFEFGTHLCFYFPFIQDTPIQIFNNYSTNAR